MDDRITRLVVFDLDGTLVDSRHDIAVAANRTLAALGLPRLPEPAVVGFIGGGVRNLALRCLAAASAPASPTIVPEAFVERFMPLYAENLLEHTRPYPGVLETLTALRAAGLVTAVVTNKPSAPARAIIEGLALGPFAAVVGGDSTPVRKPDPEPLLGVLRHVGAATHETLYVGDMAIDVETAAAAGTRFVGVTWGIGARADLEAAGATTFVDHMSELLAHVGLGAGFTAPSSSA